MNNVQLFHGDCLEIMHTMDANSVDSIVCDPPAGISFMNLKFDSDRGGRTQWIAWMTEVAAECLRLLKPGGHALVWALPRTSHWTATAWEDAGFELRDCVYHIFGSGFPKSHSIDKAIDKAAGAEREVVGVAKGTGKQNPAWNGTAQGRKENSLKPEYDATIPATDAAKQWQGWGTALKPSVECWWLLRKPLSEKSIAANVQAWGTGGINVGACRVGFSDADSRRVSSPTAYGSGKRNGLINGEGGFANSAVEIPQGRWPANLCLDPEAAALLDEMSGERPSRPTSKIRTGKVYGGNSLLPSKTIHSNNPEPNDTGGASRYFARFAHDEDDAPLRFAYVPKASRKDRNSDGVVNNTHPTCKPQMLMRWLARLCTPPGGTILDPFLGSGTTGVAAMLEGFNFIGIELDAEYLEIARRRIEHAQGQAAQPPAHMPQLPLLEMTGD